MEKNKIVSPFGSWISPITTDLLAGNAIAMDQVNLDRGQIYWTESRPAEKGRMVLMVYQDGDAKELSPSAVNVRSRVHEYGGGAYGVKDGAIYFSNFHDHRLYTMEKGGVARPVSVESKWRFADATIDANRKRVILVGENHEKSSLNPDNAIVSVSTENGEIKVLVSGNDFYAAPRLSPDGKKLCYFTWNHPQMPWDGTELWLADVLDNGTLAHAQKIAGGTEESITSPEWSPGGVLYFISDRTGFWNLYRWTGKVESVLSKDVEFARPHWVFGQSFYDFIDEKKLYATFVEKGVWRLGRIDVEKKTMEGIPTPFTEIKNLKAKGPDAIFLAGAPREAWSLFQYSAATKEIVKLRGPSQLDTDLAYFSVPEPIEFPTEKGRTAHAFYYPPNHPGYEGQKGETPPLVVLGHGGPTSSCLTVLNLGIQFWTTRGFAVVDVNYGGSTGYGRPYRDRLKGQWGIVDVEDCIHAAKYLVKQGKADSRRLAIRGGSAGGYIVLCAMTFHNVFRAGASYYGVSDAEALAKESHKFESRYDNSLIGPYPASKELYRERSPIHFADRVSQPLILFQGLDDKVVPPNQSRTFYEALKKKGVPVAYLEFEGEDHGFRKKENIKRSLEAEFFFYSKIFGFEPGEPVAPVEIENL